MTEVAREKSRHQQEMDRIASAPTREARLAEMRAIQEQYRQEATPQDRDAYDAIGALPNPRRFFATIPEGRFLFAVVEHANIGIGYAFWKGPANVWAASL